MGFKLDSGTTAAHILGVGKSDKETKKTPVPKQKTGQNKETMPPFSGKTLLQVDFNHHEKRIAWFQARVPQSVKVSIKKYAEENGISQADFVIGLVEAYGRARQGLEQ